MADTDLIFRGQTAELLIDDTDINVGTLQDAEISISQEFVYLEGQSVKWIDRYLDRVEPTVSASYGSFDPLDLKDLIDATSTGLNDSPTVQEFTVQGKFYPVEDTESTVQIEVTKVGFEDITYPWSMDDHVIKDLSGTGQDVKITEV